MSIKETAVLMPISSLCKRRGDDIKTTGSARLGVARGRSATTGTITGCNIASLQDSIRVLRSIPAFSSPRSPRFWGRTDQPRQQSPDKAWERSMISIAKCCELCVCVWPHRNITAHAKTVLDMQMLGVWNWSCYYIWANLFFK